MNESAELQSLEPSGRRMRSLRRRLTLRGELALALLPTVTVLLVLALVETLSRQRLLFASLASSAFLIYLDPLHGANRVRTLVISQMLAALLGWGLFSLLGPGYPAAGAAMVITIFLLIVLDAVHPPAISTSVSFAFKAGNESNIAIFGLAVAITAMLVFLQRSAVWLLARYSGEEEADSVSARSDPPAECESRSARGRAR
ncbi:MAG: HPP family protein [Armatimonadota bacterium]